MGVQVLTVLHDFRCEHKLFEEGPRVPARWGTVPTQICILCKAWRTTHHTNGPWQHSPIQLEPDAET